MRLPVQGARRGGALAQALSKVKVTETLTARAMPRMEILRVE
jgi:hypothetical protein